MVRSIVFQFHPVTDETDLLEPWVDWIQRSTREAEKHLAALPIEEYIVLQRRRA